MAGHSKWANIRIRKSKQDALRGILFTKLAREITVAAKLGGPDPEANPRLRVAIAKARQNRMPKESIERAIEKATKGGEGANLEEAWYEGKGPGGVAILVKVLTDNKNRTLPELRHAFTKGGGSLVPNGSVSWQFKQQGEIMVPVQSADEEALTLAALEAGAEDVIKDNGYYTIITPVEAFHKVRDALEKQNYEIESADLAMNPIQKVELSREDAQKVLRLLESLEELEDVQDTYTNAELPDDLE
ncbi:MAG TPA: YebC/PmpR family DNA-binding transcriptional regulator [Fimbriimonadales bacterium]|nr:YebC/PmpR family DNA-binding transcriptional regulator [Fimbriimonadales bacterium]